MVRQPSIIVHSIEGRKIDKKVFKALFDDPLHRIDRQKGRRRFGAIMGFAFAIVIGECPQYERNDGRRTGECERTERPLERIGRDDLIARVERWAIGFRCFIGRRRFDRDQGSQHQRRHPRQRIVADGIDNVADVFDMRPIAMRNQRDLLDVAAPPQTRRADKIADPNRLSASRIGAEMVDLVRTKTLPNADRNRTTQVGGVPSQPILKVYDHLAQQWQLKVEVAKIRIDTPPTVELKSYCDRMTTIRKVRTDAEIAGNATQTVVQNFIGGQFADPQSDRWLDVVNPATGQTIGKVPDSGAEDIDAAVHAAQSAVAGWSKLSGSERAGHLHRLANWIERNFDTLAQAECDNTGKTLRQARAMDIPRSSTNLRFFASMAETWASESHSTPEAIQYTLRQPLGVVGCISPWNLPLYLFTWKIAPALAAGNCVIGKPSEITPLTAYLLCRGVHECDWPSGVLNVVHGSGPSAGDALVRHPAIRGISFTGGTKTGKRIAELLAPRLVKSSFELGGKNPNVVFADCDYERTVQTTLRSSFANQGQICLCGSRILVQESIYERFRDDLVGRAAKMVVGDPLDEKSELGAVVSKAHFEKIMSCIELARQEGGNVRVGGQSVQPTGRCEHGYFIRPTVIDGLDAQCRTNQEEIFGPVVTLQPFHDIEEAIALANATPYGLSASVWSRDVATSLRCAERIAAGVVWVNSWLVRDLRTPFGGVGQSGLGREGGVEAMRFFTEAKNVYVPYNIV